MLTLQLLPANPAAGSSSHGGGGITGGSAALRRSSTGGGAGRRSSGSDGSSSGCRVVLQGGSQHCIVLPDGCSLECGVEAGVAALGGNALLVLASDGLWNALARGDDASPVRVWELEDSRRAVCVCGGGYAHCMGRAAQPRGASPHAWAATPLPQQRLIACTTHQQRPHSLH